MAGRNLIKVVFLCAPVCCVEGRTERERRRNGGEREINESDMKEIEEIEGMAKEKNEMQRVGKRHSRRWKWSGVKQVKGTWSERKEEVETKSETEARNRISR